MNHTALITYFIFAFLTKVAFSHLPRDAADFIYFKSDIQKELNVTVIELLELPHFVEQCLPK
jgi:hypothetical protein